MSPLDSRQHSAVGGIRNDLFRQLCDDTTCSILPQQGGYLQHVHRNETIHVEMVAHSLRTAMTVVNVIEVTRTREVELA
jgi:hypothetical protein